MAKTDTLLEAAKDARKRAFAPYSNFSVGAAILDEAGNIHIGCNVENAAYPTGSCAEENAIGAMIVAGGKTIDKILIIGALADRKAYEACVPCGACRQRIAQFCTDETRVLLANSRGEIETCTVSELLPKHFKLP